MLYINEGDFLMSLIAIIALIVALVLVLMFYNMYVQLIKKRNKVREATGGIDVQLNKRYSLIPNILTIANKFMEHEKGLMEEITSLRTKAESIKADANTISKKINLDNQIASKMGQLMVNVENYPQLKDRKSVV